MARNLWQQVEGGSSAPGARRLSASSRAGGPKLPAVRSTLSRPTRPALRRGCRLVKISVRALVSKLAQDTVKCLAQLRIGAVQKRF